MKKGFTLIELMIVVAIIAILAAIAVPVYSRYVSSAKRSAFISNFDSAVRLVRAEIAKKAAGDSGASLDPGTLCSLVDGLVHPEQPAPGNWSEPFCIPGPPDTTKKGVIFIQRIGRSIVIYGVAPDGTFLSSLSEQIDIE